MNLEKFTDREITREEAVNLLKLKGSDIGELLNTANKVREKYCGNEIHLCTITNAKSGKCKENCKFCAQSAYYETGVKTYELKQKEVLLDEYKKAKESGASHFDIVTSGKNPTEEEFQIIKEFLKETDGELNLCSSLGVLTLERAEELKKSGLNRYHTNIQTSESKYSELIATTHNFQERINTVKNAKKAGLEVCCGGILGMGESIEDRVDMAFTLKELGVDSIPINILNPIPGTPHGEREKMPINEILKSIAVYRLILKDKIIKIAAGRESILKDFMGTLFLSGINGMLVGGYLTIKGRSIEDDKKFVEDIKKLWK